MAIINWVTVEIEEGLCKLWAAGLSEEQCGEKAGSYFTGPEWGSELLFVQACRAHNEQHGVSVRATVSGCRSAVSGETLLTGPERRWLSETLFKI